MERKKFEEIIIDSLKEMDLKHSSKLLEKLWIYMNLLIEENKKYNLTAIQREDEIISKHFLDSLVFFTEYNPEDRAKIMDLGTGAGFPGLVMKIYRPELDILLLDSLQKRINFLDFLIKELQLTFVNTLHGRAEELGQEEEYREKYDYVVSRAVAPINILSEYTIPFIHPGAKVILFKGPDYQQELKEGEKAIEILGGELTAIKKVKIPNIKVERYLLEVTKTEVTPSRYPRRPGIPKKRPL